MAKYDNVLQRSHCTRLYPLLVFLTDGPHIPNVSRERDGKRLDCASSLRALKRNSAFCWAVLGYSGHNWELYALWLWFKRFASDAGYDETSASMVSFIVVGCSFLDRLPVDFSQINLAELLCASHHPQCHSSARLSQDGLQVEPRSFSVSFGAYLRLPNPPNIARLPRKSSEGK